MMDTSIPLGVKPVQIENPLNQLAQIAQLQGAQTQNSLLGLKMQQAQREESDLQSLRTGLSAPGADPYKVLIAAGKVKEATEYQEGQRKAEKAKVELVDARLKQSRSYLDNVRTPEEYIAWHQANHADPILGPELAARGVTPEKSMASIQQALQTPGGFEDLLRKSALGIEEFTKQNKPHFQAQDNGQQSQILAIPGLGGAPAVVSSVQKVATPGEQLSATTSTENNKRSVGASFANAAATREIAQATRDAANIQTGFKNEQDLRKEFEGLPEVKNYKQAFPAYAAIRDAATRNTTQSDINIVYGIAKLYDPNSVVREGEYATVANSPNIPERIKGYAQYLQGGGKLSPETKRQILAEAQGRIGSYETEARKARGSYEQIAKQRGMNPGSVFADMGEMTAGSKPPAPAPAASPTGLPPGWTVRPH